jgi:hypothetical protein
MIKELKEGKRVFFLSDYKICSAKIRKVYGEDVVMLYLDDIYGNEYLLEPKQVCETKEELIREAHKVLCDFYEKKRWFNGYGND